MGKLFWKFFLIIWLAQLVTMLGIGLAVDLTHRREGSIQHAQQQASERPSPSASQSDHLPPPRADGMRLDKHGPYNGPWRMPLLLLVPLEPLLAGLFVSLLFAATLAWNYSRPIRSLREGFSALARGELDTRLGDTLGRRNDEFGDLGRAFDGMASQLGDLVGAQRRLLHDVSHELRSPLARLQAATGLARQQPEKLETTMLRIEREALRMDQLIDELLTLSRLEAGSDICCDEEAALHDLLEGIVEDARFEAKQLEIEISLTGDTTAHLRCRPDLLHRALENLVRNAIKYSPPGSTVSIVINKPGTTHFELRFEDQGPGIPPEDLEAVFKPFVRSRASRISTGHGLGLAIARRVIEAHGGNIDASNRPEGGLCVRVVFPASILL